MISHKIKKGYDIRLAGKSEKSIVNTDSPKYLALQPPDFYSVKPKLSVELGSQVKIGSELFYDKTRPEVKFLSPASGKIIQINRGERRAITEIVVESDNKDEFIRFKKWSKQDIAKLQKKYNQVIVSDFITNITKEKNCFILMPFKPDFDVIYQDIIQKVLKKKSIIYSRADEIYGVRAIIDDIEGSITLSDFLIE